MVESGTTKLMRAIVQEEVGGPESLKIGDLDMPVPNENEVLIKVEYSAVNRADTLQVQYIVKI